MNSRILKIIKLRERGFTLLQIGDRFNISKQRVKQLSLNIDSWKKRLPFLFKKSFCKICNKSITIKFTYVEPKENNKTLYCSKGCLLQKEKKTGNTPEEKRAFNRERMKRYYKSKKGKKILKKSSKKSHKKYKEKYKVYGILRNNLKSGKIEKPDKCEKCKTKDFIRLNAHHDDYSKPLEVRWLCTVCHGVIHKNMKEKLAMIS